MQKKFFQTKISKFKKRNEFSERKTQTRHSQLIKNLPVKWEKSYLTNYLSIHQ